jgi:large subunit ribosomal protein L15
MHLNTLSPAPGSTKPRRRVGRGIGSGLGKTCGTGHKGQKSRSGGTIRPGFEGGQMPLQRRLPKFGFTSRIGRLTAEVRTSELQSLDVDVIDIAALRKANLITKDITRVKVMLSGDVTKAVTVDGLRVTKGARAAIESAGGKIIDLVVPANAGKKKTKKVRTEG